MTKIGFTGSRKGMTQKQVAELLKLIVFNHPFELHHGDCVGADAKAHKYYSTYPEPGKRIVIHPPINDELRAYCHLDKIIDDTIIKVREEKHYLDRNRDIVDETDFLLAFPNGSDRSYGRAGKSRQGGTWYTIRYARSINKPVTIVYLNGNIDRLY